MALHRHGIAGSISRYYLFVIASSTRAQRYR
jgi:hypothetical protein